MDDARGLDVLMTIAVFLLFAVQVYTVRQFVVFRDSSMSFQARTAEFQAQSAEFQAQSAEFQAQSAEFQAGTTTALADIVVSLAAISTELRNHDRDIAALVREVFRRDEDG